ncbi:YdcF family protein [Novosphingobium sp. 1949]|uniref:YdcF family protein n=1 Tax=Novosphingobium organovorum TaxID=2930092 RepID=A0ABT0BEL2_9SPHN|nr:YdcF family protein [Novosphingobium organovorum]MCJ2183502.1 YdcF family protein [Novosphingobium organovorum]
MFRRTAAFAVLVWFFGFVWFAVTLPGPLDTNRTSDAIIVLTGSKGRIEHALALLKRGEAPRLFVSGVDPEVRPAEFAAEFAVPARLMSCCVELGFEAYNTRSNAIETARWVAEHKVRTIRLVTADWHMRRARLDLQRELPKGIVLEPDAVPSHPSLSALFLEYHKLLWRLASQYWEK